MPETESKPKQIIDEAVEAVDALQLAVDTLGMIANFGGVQGDWALKALERISVLVVGGSPRLPQAIPLSYEEQDPLYVGRDGLR